MRALVRPIFAVCLSPDALEKNENVAMSYIQNVYSSTGFDKCMQM